MADVLRAVAYARYSSDGQREESIEAQVRAIKEFAKHNGYALQKIYADRGISGTTDNRPQFQSMIDDAKTKHFDVIIVHKLDRFARNRADSAIYRKELEKNGVKLISVIENFDDTPESIILQSVIEGYNEYYSKNLRREVMKGLKENALSCRHTGGIPCLGYDVDKTTMKLVVNEYEAGAVRLIFNRYIAGEGYTAIIEELNRKGYRTKRGGVFGKNSLYEILRNEKYCGVYIYNKSVHPDENGKFNRHAQKSDDEIIRIEGGVPQIISKEVFEIARQKMQARRRRTAAFKAKQEYLLSGKIICGECGSTYAGNSRQGAKQKQPYISYNCVKRNGKVSCKNPGIKRDELEQLVLNRLSEAVFNEDVLPTILEKYNDYALSRNNEYMTESKEIKQKIAETEKGISNIVDIVVATGSAALTDKLKELEKTKSDLERALFEAEKHIEEMHIDRKRLKAAFKTAKEMLRSGTLKNRKAIVGQYVKKIIIYKDKIVLEYSISDTYSFKEEIDKEKPQ